MSFGEIKGLSSSDIAEKGVTVDLRSKRKAVAFGGLPLFLLSFQTLGIIYSDIGTSPLYVLNGIWPSSGPAPSTEDVIGGVSAIIWAMTLLPLLKYTFISLKFGTREGEGGSFALFQGLFPPAERDFDAERTLTGDSHSTPLSDSGGGRRIKPMFRWPMLIWCLFGTALTMADGIFTPAVSVTSAVGGIAIAKPSVVDHIIPISIVLLLALFLIQRFGTERVAFSFAPISFIWFLLLGGTGIYNITFYPGIFRAIDPSRAILLFVRTKQYDILAGVLLAVTGCEAMFANLGQFNALSIQISFTGFVYPALVLAYLGQGARLIVDGDSVILNIFYETIPGPPRGALFWIVFVFAILATIIASQAMITATFSLFQQLINTKNFPPIRMLYTSEKMQGQIYIPAVNWALMIGTITIVGAFKNLTSLTDAYGFAVATVMFSTSILIAIQIYYTKHLPLILAAGYLITFGFFDALFWGASFQKVPAGAWVPLMIGSVLGIIMLLWTWGKSLEDEFDGENRMNLRHFIQQGEGLSSADKEDEVITVQDYDEAITEGNTTLYYASNTSRDGTLDMVRKKLQRIPSCAVFHKITGGKGVPHTFIGFIRQWPALPRVVLFLSVSIVPVPRVPVKDRYAVTKVRTIEGFYGVTYYVGWKDDFNVNTNDLIDRICEIEQRSYHGNPAAIIEEIRAAARIATHIAPHYHVMSKKLNAGAASGVVNWIRQFLIEDIYRRLATMFPETGRWLNSADEIIHVGINAAI